MPAYSIFFSAVRVKWMSRQGPSVAASTFSAIATDSVATRREWPDVVGSRDSIAVTDAFTKPSNRRWISS